jgi:uridine phosphorylase
MVRAMTVGHHIRLGADHLAGNRGLGRYVLLPGDPARAARIASHFADVQVVDSPRGLTAHLGTLQAGCGSVDVLTLPSGMGSPSAEVVLHELLTAGARRILRVGSCGSMRSELSPGQLVIATGAVRDDGTTDHYAPREYPALAHPRAVAALIEGARRAGLESETFQGICHAKASLYAREFGLGPAGEANLAYTAWLRRCGVLASEMETAALFVLSSTFAPRAYALAERGDHEPQAGAVLAVFASDDSHMQFDMDVAHRAESRAIDVALEAVRAWAERDLAASP